jgi:hypothetical protein
LEAMLVSVFMHELTAETTRLKVINFTAKEARVHLKTIHGSPFGIWRSEFGVRSSC